jgi:hypothetical protein
MSIQVKQFESRVLIAQAASTGVTTTDFIVVSGSRMLCSLLITAIDPGASIQLTLGNTFSADDGYEIINTISGSSVGRFKAVLSDFHNMFRVTATVIGGNATYKVGISLFDNAVTTRIENAEINVALDANDDSVKIGDGTNYLKINSDGAINVSSIPVADERMINAYMETTAIPSGSETLISTYTVPSGKTAYLYQAEASGENIATFFVYLNGTRIGTQRTYFGGGLNVDFDFAYAFSKGLALAAGDIVTLKTLHNRPTPGDFEGKLLILLKG